MEYSRENIVDQLWSNQKHKQSTEKLLEKSIQRYYWMHLTRVFSDVCMHQLHFFCIFLLVFTLLSSVSLPHFSPDVLFPLCLSYYNNITVKISVPYRHWTLPLPLHKIILYPVGFDTQPETKTVTDPFLQELWTCDIRHLTGYVLC